MYVCMHVWYREEGNQTDNADADDDAHREDGQLLAEVVHFSLKRRSSRFDILYVCTYVCMYVCM